MDFSASEIMNYAFPLQKNITKAERERNLLKTDKLEFDPDGDFSTSLIDLNEYDLQLYEYAVALYKRRYSRSFESKSAP